MYSLLWIYLCLLSVFIVHGFSDIVEYEEDTDVPDRPFPSSTIVYKKNVTCDPSKIPPGMKFPAQTWTCADARIDGRRLVYGFYPGIGVDIKCTETKGLDELAQLCLVMMNAMEVDKPLWAAIITNATCERHEATRHFLNKTVEGFEWATLGPGHGWVDTFRCMAER